MISSAFWRDRSVFVTGHTGFKGAWLSLMLERLTARTTGYGLPPATDLSLFEIADASASLCDVRGDVCDAALLDGALRAADADIVIHLATRPPRDPDSVASATRRNTRACERALSEAVEAAPSVQAALVVSPDLRDKPRGRARRGGPQARVISVWCPDPIGGGDFAAVARGPDSSLHVLDALYGVLLLAEQVCESGGRIGDHWAFAEPEDAAALGWSPLLTPAEAEFWTVEWRNAFVAGADMRKVTRDQVDAYLGQRVRLTSPFADELKKPLRAVA